MPEPSRRPPALPPAAVAAAAAAGGTPAAADAASLASAGPRPGAADTPAQQAWLAACTLDVAVRKAGNVSRASAGHGMQAAQFVAAAAAAAPALLRAGATLGERIEGATRASLAVAGCNTNLGIVLLGAPLAAAMQAVPVAARAEAVAGAAAGAGAADAAEAAARALRAAVVCVLQASTRDDAVQAFRAIAAANPGGLGEAPAEDVRSAPTTTLREAMALAAQRDRIAEAWAGDFAPVFDLGLPAFRDGLRAAARTGAGPAAAARAATLCAYVELLAGGPDSHIVRKHGEAVAQSVMVAAQGHREALRGGRLHEATPAWVAWDEALKRLGVNPGTSADLVVATAFAGLWCEQCAGAAPLAAASL
ncbi:triphosphoribosyl-dephospho-CoA synthase [Piscinibacter sakaiensis]|uniref:Triphosphoribosyl-dephospho-CoA synthetase n=1 Tax=Piscinibacter sakaiensis TaxID=1547922 RepID=A0A0K8NU72_PISS1|nr:triphosphoribosyl-dephospho-CoA synthase [Piscinibacter sakaiensis]GAP33937.1 triphosphoribosyl-dephospho-CoA synthetase [Piscinibacter sakaiensis]